MTFDSAEALETALAAARAEYLPLHAGGATASLRRIALPRALLVLGQGASHGLWRGIWPAGGAGFALLEPDSSPAVRDGQPWRPGEIAAFAGGTPFHLRATGRVTWLLACLDRDALAAVLPAGAGPTLPTAPWSAAPALTALAARLREVPDAAARGDLQGATEPALFEALRADLAIARTDPARSAATRQRYRQWVEAALAYMDARIDQPIYTAGLCSAVGISERMLRDAFAAIFGLSAHQVLKRRRLARVRRALMHADGTGFSVKSAALMHGFWHFGRLAADYRALFGESPAATLRGSRALARPERERPDGR